MKYYFFIVSMILILFYVKNVSAGSENSILSEQIKAKEEEIRKLEAEEVIYRQAISIKQSESKTLKNQISQIKNQIRYLNTSLNVTKLKISKTESNIKLHYLEIRKKEAEINSRQLVMAESIKFLARLENQSFISVILRGDKFSDFFNWTKYLINFEAGLYDNFKTLAQKKIELENFLENGKILKEDLNNFKKDLIIKDRLIKNQKQEKDQLFSKTKSQEKEYQKIISQLQIRQAEIQRQIFEFENKLRGEVKSVPPAQPGVLAWPMIGRITQGYGPTSVTGFYNDVYKFHNGIDINAYYGSYVGASLGGVVTASGDDGDYAYGNWLAIHHDNGLTTLYAHLSVKAVFIGDRVSQGQLIGYEGSSGFVTGPHLHFTVYSTNTFKTEERWFGILPLGGSINPFNYLLQ